MDYSVLYEKIKRGQSLTSFEKEEVYNSIRKKYSEIEDLYTLALVYTKVFVSNEANVKVLEFFLFSEEIEDPDLAGVLYGLLKNWSLTERYLDYINKYTKSESWEEWSETGIVVHSVLGDLFYEKKNKYSELFSEYVKNFWEEYEKVESTYADERIKNWLNTYVRSLYISLYGPQELVKLIGSSPFNKFRKDEKIQNDLKKYLKK